MTTSVHLVTVPSADMPGTCIFVRHQQHSYLLGRVVDGTQRAFTSRKLHFGGVDHVFLSGPVEPDGNGGLLGLLLSVGAGVESCRENHVSENEKRRAKGQKLLPPFEHAGVGVHGGDNLCHVLAAGRAVIMRQPVKVEPFEQRVDPRAAHARNADPDFQDDAVRVWKIPVRRAVSPSPPKRCHDSLDGPDDEASIKPPSTLSDPDVAALIIKHVMFTGSTKDRSLLLPRRLRQLTPDDVALVFDDGKLAQYKGPYATHGNALPNPERKAWVFQGLDEPTVTRSPQNGCLSINGHPLPPTCYGQTSMSYILKCHDRRGKFNAPVADQLGVRKQDFKRLTAGESVPGKDGTTVTPDMVLGERQPGNGIAVADIPSLDFVDGFMERPEWQNAELMANVVAMYWILGPGLARHPRVQSFMEAHPSIKHMLCADETCPNMITHPGPAELQAKLRRIDPQRFPLLDFANAVGFPAPERDSPVELGRAGRSLMLMPRVIHKQDTIAPFPDLATAASQVPREVLELGERARAQASDAEFLARVDETERDLPNRDADIIPLGTGSSAPSKYRNVSGTLIRVPGIGNYLLDCGEGTLGQVRRALGADAAVDALRSLRCIVISHLHADHHTGAVPVIKAWYEQALRDRSTATLAVSCIARYRTLLQELSQAQDFGFHRLRFPNCPPDVGDRDLVTADDLAAMAGPGDGDGWGLAGVRRVAVPHCWRSYATEIELSSGLRIAYSGDCRPSAAFAQACRDAHLLVHECTFADDRADHARAKRHSSVSEALGIARDMRARRTLLTHFSQRYSKADSLAQPDAPDRPVLLALDMMRVRLGDFQVAACYVPAVQALLEGLDE